MVSSQRESGMTHFSRLPKSVGERSSLRSSLQSGEKAAILKRAMLSSDTFCSFT